MVHKYCSRLFVFLLILVVLFLNEARPTVASKRKPIRNLKDPKVIMVAKFAVMKYNEKASKKLEFVAVVNGTQQLLEGIGMDYHLVISAKDGKNYVAVVKFRPRLRDKLQLSSFDEAKPVLPAGAWTPITNLEDSWDVMVAEVAVMVYNRHANKSLDFVAIVKGEECIVSVAEYKLVISTKNGAASHPKSYSARVWLKPWQPGILEFVLESFKETKN